MVNFFTKLISTFFYVGYLPFIPGTFGSLAGIILFFFIKDNTLLYIVAMAVVIFCGFLFSGKAERLFNRQDAKYIVIDEISGMLLSMLFVPVNNIKLLIVGFFLFRIFDTLKPYPAGVLEKLHGSRGIMGDDLIAAFYTNITLQFITLNLASLTTS